MGALAGRDRSLTLSAAGLALVCVCIVGVQWARERLVIAAELATTREAAVRVERMLSEIEAGSAPIARMQHLIASTAGAEILAALTAAIPADTWLQQLDLRCPDAGACAVRFTAITPGASLLVDSLERSPRFTNTRLHASSAAGLAQERDRAEISAQWVEPAPVKEQAP